jgi:hypothetical protein
MDGWMDGWDGFCMYDAIRTKQGLGQTMELSLDGLTDWLIVNLDLMAMDSNTQWSLST